MYVCMYVCVYVVYACMYVRMYVYLQMYDRFKYNVLFVCLLETASEAATIKESCVRVGSLAITRDDEDDEAEMESTEAASSQLTHEAL